METIGPYRVIRRLAAGGMGEVYLARSVAAGVARPCVVKTIHARLDGDDSARKRFLDEARLALQLSHKNICGVTHVGEHDGGLFMAMDFVAGRDLRDVLRALHTSGRRMTPPLSLYLLREILDGLDYAHRACDVATGAPLMLVHRDLSPSNVMISVEGEVKIIDFGQALSTMKLERTAAGIVFGKLPYLSPEQARSEPLDHRSDLYSLAILATELLAGAPYYQGVPRERMTSLVQAGYRSPLLDVVDGPIRDMLQLALDPHRDARTASAEQMRTRVDRLLVQRQAVVGPSDLRHLLVELFPGEIERQRAVLAEASGSAPLVPPTPTPTTASTEDDTAPEDGFGVTEVIPTAVARALSRERPRAGPRRAPIAIGAVLGLAVLTAAIAIVAVVGTRSQRAIPAPSRADAGMAALGPHDPPLVPADPRPPEPPQQPQPAAVIDAGTVDRDALTVVPVAPAEPRPPPRHVRPRTTAEKLKLLDRCKHRCAAGVLDKYSRFATLSVDEARVLAAELEACVKRCGG
ncbi:MAG: serine/threonine protein kinase [Deltaproteobacteria bacterium]|nr:serine/threonine protein kinase [Deltaproteobacteria bacterium]